MRFKPGHSYLIRIVASILIYLALWGLTEIIGVSQVLPHFLERKFPPSSTRGHELEFSKHEVVAVAPFIIRGSYIWLDGPVVGAGGNSTYLWIGLGYIHLFDSNQWVK